MDQSQGWTLIATISRRFDIVSGREGGTTRNFEEKSSAALGKHPKNYI